MNFESVGGRSFFMAMGCGITTSAMRIFDKLDNPTYGMIISVTVGAFIAKSGWDEHTQVRAEVQRDIAKTQAEASPPAFVEQVAPK